MSIDNVYYNITIKNNTTNTFSQQSNNSASSPLTEATYDTDLSIPLLDNPSEYYMAITNVDINMQSIPIASIRPAINSGTTNKTDMLITILANGQPMTNGGTQLIFVPDDLTAVQPNQNSPLNVISPDSNYYFIYSYNSLIKMLNTALITEFSIYAGNYPLALAAVAPPPYFGFNSATQSIYLIANGSWAQGAVSNPSNPVITIAINEDLSNYLQGFYFKFNSLTLPALPQYGVVNFSIFQLIASYSNAFPANLQPPMTLQVNTLYFQFFQDYPNLNTWNYMKKLVITSNSLPIEAEALPSNYYASSTSLSTYAKIISDYTPNFNSSNASETRGISYYFPTAQYRLLDLLSSQPLRKIQISIYWIDTYGILHPLLLNEYATCSIKIAFVKKSLYNKKY